MLRAVDVEVNRRIAQLQAIPAAEISAVADRRLAREPSRSTFDEQPDQGLVTGRAQVLQLLAGVIERVGIEPFIGGSEPGVDDIDAVGEAPLNRRARDDDADHQCNSISVSSSGLSLVMAKMQR